MAGYASMTSNLAKSWVPPIAKERLERLVLVLGSLAIAVGDEAVIAVGTGRGLHPPDDEPHRRGVGLSGDTSAFLDAAGFCWT